MSAPKPSDPTLIAESVRRWNPWYLRRQIATFMRDIDRRDTESERDWRFFAATLDGHPTPGRYALRYSVEGSTLCIDTTEDGA